MLTLNASMYIFSHFEKQACYYVQYVDRVVTILLAWVPITYKNGRMASFKVSILVNYTITT